MDKETFETGFKLLERFLKDKGLYNSILKNFLFRGGRKKEDLFKEFNNRFYTDVDNWKVLFNRVNLMIGDKNNNKFNPQEWEEKINSIGLISEWADYYENNKK